MGEVERILHRRNMSLDLDPAAAAAAAAAACNTKLG
jgi:hypothetical protein